MPNHVAPDHPAVTTHPDWFVRGTAQERAAAPEAWFDIGGTILAHGRDPYFPPWPDVVQLNTFRPEVRQAAADALGRILEQCDGVRCDMAMLLTNDVFGKTWGEHAGTAPAEEFWPVVLGPLRLRHPDAVLIAEAYWTWSGRCSSRASTSGTTSGCTTGWSTPTPRPYGCTWAPGRATSGG